MKREEYGNLRLTLGSPWTSNGLSPKAEWQTKRPKTSKPHS